MWEAAPYANAPLEIGVRSFLTACTKVAVPYADSACSSDTLDGSPLEPLVYFFVKFLQWNPFFAVCGACVCGGVITCSPRVTHITYIWCSLNTHVHGCRAFQRAVVVGYTDAEGQLHLNPDDSAVPGPGSKLIQLSRWGKSIM